MNRQTDSRPDDEEEQKTLELAVIETVLMAEVAELSQREREGGNADCPPYPSLAQLNL